MKRFVRTFCAIAMLALLGVASYGQSSTGSISGVVSDQNQAVIPAASITIRNTATGFTRSSTQVAENVRAQLWIDCFNAFNSRNFGIPSGVASSPGFLNQWATDGGNRRIRLGVRLVF
jgi:hypothetical protein